MYLRPFPVSVFLMQIVVLNSRCWKPSPADSETFTCKAIYLGNVLGPFFVWFYIFFLSGLFSLVRGLVVRSGVICQCWIVGVEGG